MDFETRMRGVVARVADIRAVRDNPDLRLYDDGILDSFSTVERLVKLSIQFAVALSPAEVDHEGWKTPRRIAVYLRQRIAS